MESRSIDDWITLGVGILIIVTMVYMIWHIVRWVA